MSLRFFAKFSLLSLAFYSTQEVQAAGAAAPNTTTTQQPAVASTSAKHLIQIVNKCNYDIRIGYAGPGLEWQLDSQPIPKNGGSIFLGKPTRGKYVSEPPDLTNQDRPGLVFSAFAICTPKQKDKSDANSVDSCQIGSANSGTLAEISWFQAPTAQSTYDVSAVNGFNFPIMISPVKGPGKELEGCKELTSAGLDVKDCPAFDDLSAGTAEASSWEVNKNPQDPKDAKQACVLKPLPVNAAASKSATQITMTDSKGKKAIIGCQSPRTLSYLLRPRTTTERGGYPLYTCDYDDPHFTVPDCYKAKKPPKPADKTEEQHKLDLQHDWCAESGVATKSSYVKWIRTKNPYVYAYPSDDFDIDGRHVGYACTSSTKQFIITVGPNCPGEGTVTPPPVKPPVNPPVNPPIPPVNPPVNPPIPPVNPPVTPPTPPITPPPASKGNAIVDIPGATWSADADGMSFCVSKKQTAGRAVGSGSILHYTFTKPSTPTSYDTPGQQNVPLAEQSNVSDAMCYKIPKSNLAAHNPVYVFFTLFPDPAMNTKWASVDVPENLQK